MSSSVVVALIALSGVLVSVGASWLTQRGVAAKNRKAADIQFKIAQETSQKQFVTALEASQTQFIKEWQVSSENATTQSTAAGQLDEWRQREETFRMLRWASDHVVSPKSSGEPLMGILVLSELSTVSAEAKAKAKANSLVQKRDEVFVNQVALIVWGVAKSVAMVVLTQATRSKNKTTGGSGEVQIQLDAQIIEAAILAVRADGLLRGARGAELGERLHDDVIKIAKGSVGATIPVSPITVHNQAALEVRDQGLEGHGPISKDSLGL